MFDDALGEFRADWLVVGKARSTVDCHVSLLRVLAGYLGGGSCGEVSVAVLNPAD